MTTDKTTMRDAELRAALESAVPAFDPAFRVRVMQRICERARRRAILQRTAIWIAAGIGTGFAAQLLTPPETGVPSAEIIAMTASIGAAALMLATLTATGAGGVARWLERTFNKTRHG
ncbi:MAG: hypothetical protein HOP13_02740 [Alphaproteobacteria bacterium]|nr:hypothetical protein [Alphaproteobacteria bacterium]